MKVVGWILCLLSWTSIQDVSAAAPKNYYETRVLQFPKRLPSGDLRAGVMDAAKAQKLRRIRVREADGTFVTLFPDSGLNPSVSKQVLSLIHI